MTTAARSVGRALGRWRVRLLVAAALLAPVVILALTYAELVSIGEDADALAVREFQAQQGLLSAQAAERVAELFRATELELRALQAPVEPSDDREWLSGRAPRGILMLAHDRYGRVVATPRELPPEHAAWLRARGEGRRTDPPEGCSFCTEGRSFLTVSRVLDEDRDLHVTAAIDPAVVYERLFASLGEHDGYVWVMDEYRTVVASPDVADVGSRPFEDLDPRVRASIEPTLAAMTMSSAGTDRYLWPDGEALEERLVAFTPVPGRTDLSVAHSVDLASVLARTRAFHERTQKTLLRLVGLLLLGLGLGMAFLVWRNIQSAAKVRRLGQYVLEGQLGSGGMGVVYRARHALLRRPTAVKVLDPIAKLANPERFEREVRATARLTHPNTITVYDYGHTPDGQFYYAMELLDGVTLQQAVEASGAMKPARVVHLLEQIAGALAEAHDAGLIHRDVKPSNIMISCQGGEHDVAKVLDFGLVAEVGRIGEGADRSVVGTPLYMSPEAIRRPNEVDARSDLYALGSVAYFLLTGGHLFAGRTVAEVCGHQLSTRPEPPSQRMAKPVLPELEALILSLLAKHRDDRPRSAHEVLDRLEACELPERWSRDAAREWWHRHAAPAAKIAPPADFTAQETLAVEVSPRFPETGH